MSFESINIITEQILRCAFKVHSALGPGLLESSYKECLYYELMTSGLYTEKEKPLPLVYEQVKLDVGYRVDLLIEKKIIVEIKAVEALNDVHTAQVLTYLKLSGCKVGLLLNFNTSSLKNGIKRLIL
ncbi:GxxExxY protein [Niabella sp. W65]|nr:GxxExxY protein [Niabella sp. W65]MCH7368168.1 GxxExxY protein [Niabella sp. W65]